MLCYRGLLALFCVFPFFFSSSIAQENKSGGDSIRIVGGAYFDVESASFKPNRGIVINDGVFKSLADSDSDVDRTITLNDEHFILPGIVDLHAHYNVRLFRNRREEFNVIPVTYLANGATVTFSCGEYLPDKMFELRKRIEKGEQIGPRLITSGPYYGMARPGWGRNGPGAEKIREEVEYWAKTGIGGIKAKLIDPDSLEVLIEAAHAHDLTVTGHLDSGFRNSVNPRDAIEMGIDRIEHFLGGDALPNSQSAYASLQDLSVDSPEFKSIVDLYVKKGTWFDATISAYGYYGARGEEFDYWIDEREFFTPYVREHVSSRAERRVMQQFEKIYQVKQKSIVEFWKAGGKITLGTDHFSNGNFIAGFGVHREMDVMVRSGIPENDVLKIATINGARAIGIDDHHGSIEPGKSADLYIIRGNPLESIRHTRNGVWVMTGGKIYDTRELLDSVKGKLGPTNQEEAKSW